MRKFISIDFMVEQVPDATTLLHFRRLIEESGLGKAFFEAINRCLEKCRHIMKGGTIVDATLINAPSSTKNSAGSRDPEMKQTKKGNQWYFGMKCHMGVDAGTGYIHSIGATAANVHDIAKLQSSSGQMMRLYMEMRDILVLTDALKLLETSTNRELNTVSISALEKYTKWRKVRRANGFAKWSTGNRQYAPKLSMCFI